MVDKIRNEIGKLFELQDNKLKVNYDLEASYNIARYNIDAITRTLDLL